MDYENLSLAVDDGVATLAIDRPKSLNALNEATLEELRAVFATLKDDPRVRVVIVTGTGDKAFVAGADIKELAQQTSSTAHATARRGQEVFRAIEVLGKPVIAAVNGFALGGGLELALACHLRIASENAKLGLPEVSLGVIPGFGGTQRLARLVGRGRALELILTGDPIDAAEAHRIGLVNRVVASDDLEAETTALARRILLRGPVALSHALLAVDAGLESGLAQGMLTEATLFGLLFGTEDMREGMDAFLGKRKPEFQGR